MALFVCAGNVVFSFTQQHLPETRANSDVGSANLLHPAPVADRKLPHDNLQSTLGNQAVLRLIQTKLTVSNPNDKYEQEADRLSELVMRKPTAAAPRACGCDPSSSSGGECAECKAKEKPAVSTVQRKPVSSEMNAVDAPSAEQVLQSTGQPLDRATRAFMEPRFGHDFSEVRVHTSQPAAESASALQARAYTHGRDIVFGVNQYQPQSHEGQALLAHELSHVIQQGHAGPFPDEHNSADNPTGDLQLSIMPGVETIARDPDPPDAGVPSSDAADAGTPQTDPMDAGAGASPDSPGGERYSRQAACVARLGGCITTRDAGMVEDADITNYNETCRAQTRYEGNNIRPSEVECRQYTSGQLVDPAKIQRLQALTMQYVTRLQRGELGRADVERIDAALRRACNALRSTGMPLPEMPAAPEAPSGMGPDAQVLALGMVGLTPTGPVTGGPPAGLLAGEALSGGTAVAEGTAATATAVGEGAATATAVGEGAAVATTAVEGGVAAETVVAGAGAAAFAEALLIIAIAAAALLVIAGVLWLVYELLTAEDPHIDPRVPEVLDESIETIEHTLENARPPVAGPAREAAPVPEIGELPNQRRHPNQTCRNEVLDRLQDEMHRTCDSIPGPSCSPSRSAKMLARIPCSVIRQRIEAFRECLRKRQEIQDTCFGGIPDARHVPPMEQINQGLANCERLAAVNCAPGHPMSTL